jgi:hypothetical protein
MNTYALASDTIKGMEIGDSRTIDIPKELMLFRKYLSADFGKQVKCKYRTWVIDQGRKITIMRIPYFNANEAIKPVKKTLTKKRRK